MTNKWLQLLEAHIEKGILGLAVLFAGAMVWMFLIQSPNTVTYQNKDCGPRELFEAIKSEADSLDRAVRGAEPPPPEDVEFSDELMKQHGEGIFAKESEGGIRLAAELPLATTFGRDIVVPGLEGAEGDPVGTIELVTPLRPTQPKLRTGRSLALHEQVRISYTPEPVDEKADVKIPKAAESAWVTVAAYFDKKAQYDEMIKAGYAPYRSKAYVVGVDVQRKEMLSTGEFSDWQDVTPGQAMPKLDLSEPQFDDQTGQLINKDEIRQTFALVKDSQTTLMQPSFYMVEAGDFWEVPALAGYEDDEEEDGEEEEDSVLAARSGRTAPGGAGAGMRPSGRRSSGAGVSRGSGRSAGGSARGGSARGASSGRGGRPSGGGATGGGGSNAQDEADIKRAARKEVRELLNEARKMIGQKEYADARQIAESVIGNEFASKGDKRNAESVVKLADRWLKVQEERASGMGVGGQDGVELVTKPETDEPAVWFHDDTVEAGKTYQYRMRVKLWNRYVGRLRAVKDIDEAKVPTVLGEWSFPSDPITVTPSTYFFLSGSQPNENSASVDVWKWRKGFWKKQRFDVTIGDVIGDSRNIKTGEYNTEGEEVAEDVDFTTDAVVLDLRFNEKVKDRWPGKDGFSYRDKTSTVLTYLDPADGQVKERVLIFDRSDPKNKELKDEDW